MCSINQLSETKEQYAAPVIMKEKPTRQKSLQHFLWRELYAEYLRHSARENNVKPEPALTEYFDEFCKHSHTEDLQAKEELHATYPLYCTTAITLWNTDGDPTKDFKKRYLITRPVQEQYEQWG